MNDRDNQEQVGHEISGSSTEIRRSWTPPALTRLQAGKAEILAANQSDGVSTQS